MCDKFGLFSQQKGDNDLLDGLFVLMICEKSDYIWMFCLLSYSEQFSVVLLLCDEFIDCVVFDSWFVGYCVWLCDEQVDDVQCQQRMQGVNLVLVLCNWLVQWVIEQVEVGDMGELECLYVVLVDFFIDCEDDYVCCLLDWGKCLEVSCLS